MKVFIEISILIILLLLSVQDIRERQISVWMIIGLFIFSCAKLLLASNFSHLIKVASINSIYSGLILVSGTLLVRMKQAKTKDNSFVGSGDYLFLFAISPLFCFESYLVFLNTSFLLVLLVYAIIKALNRNKIRLETIPLAGGVGFCLISLIIINHFLPTELLSENMWFYNL